MLATPRRGAVPLLFPQATDFQHQKKIYCDSKKVSYIPEFKIPTMAVPTTAQFGTWKSPITVETITAESSDIIEVNTTVGFPICSLYNM